MRGVYIHIPFCNSICSYCDFCKFLHNDVWASAYLTILLKEVDEYYEKDMVKSIYIGGGTPSVLSRANLSKLFYIVSLFKKSNNCEFTFECNVNDIDIDLLSMLQQNGVNRLSIGIESFDKYKLKYLNRKHEKEDIINKINLAKRYFDNINVDLIYALPMENMHMLKKDISEILKLDVSHISTYSLIIEPHTVLYNKRVVPINEDLDAKMYEYICSKLSKNGYVHYEVSNFSKVGKASVHNLTYWSNQEYYGFGLGAHGFINHVRYENTRNFNKYLEKKYRLNEGLTSTIEDMENELMLGLRKLEGINIVRFEDKFGVNIFDAFPKLHKVIKAGYITLEDEMLFIKEDKIYIMNEILNMIM